jgi:antitoxin HicB
VAERTALGGRDIAKVEFGWPTLPVSERRAVGGALVVAKQARSARSIRISRRDADCAPRLHQESAKDAARGVGAGATADERADVTSTRGRHIGSSFESWLDEVDLRSEVTAAAVKAVLARQLAAEMKKKGISKKRMAELMNTSRAQVDRLLDPDYGSATLESLLRAARVVGRELRLELV